MYFCESTDPEVLPAAGTSLGGRVQQPRPHHTVHCSAADRLAAGEGLDQRLEPRDSETGTGLARIHTRR
ncbi:unnamed protein product [Merluccius merluccius]